MKSAFFRMCLVGISAATIFPGWVSAGPLREAKVSFVESQKDLVGHFMSFFSEGQAPDVHVEFRADAVYLTENPDWFRAKLKRNPQYSDYFANVGNRIAAQQKLLNRRIETARKLGRNLSVRFIVEADQYSDGLYGTVSWVIYDRSNGEIVDFNGTNEKFDGFNDGAKVESSILSVKRVLNREIAELEEIASRDSVKLGKKFDDMLNRLNGGSKTYFHDLTTSRELRERSRDWDEPIILDEQTKIIRSRKQ